MCKSIVKRMASTAFTNMVMGGMVMGGKPKSKIFGPMFDIRNPPWALSLLSK